MDDLREKVARVIFFRGGEQDDKFWKHTQSHHRDLAREQADAILAMPEIAEALLLMDTARRRYGESIMQSDPSAIYYQGLQNAHPWANLLKPEDMPSA